VRERETGRDWEREREREGWKGEEVRDLKFTPPDTAPPFPSKLVGSAKRKTAEKHK